MITAVGGLLGILLSYIVSLLCGQPDSLQRDRQVWRGWGYPAGCCPADFIGRYQYFGGGGSYQWHAACRARGEP